MKRTIDISVEHQNMLLDLLRQYIPGVKVWAYGSRVKGRGRRNSDLDLVAFATPEQAPSVSDLTEALAESNLPFLVDLHVWNDLPEPFRERIREEYAEVHEGDSASASD